MKDPEANDREFEEGQRVLHNEYGSGTVTRLYDSDVDVVRVEFDSMTQFINVKPDELEPFESLLRDTDMEVGQERVDPEDGLAHGEVRIDLDFDRGVEYDVDVGPDGNIIVQYWRHEVCVHCGDDIPKDRSSNTCSTQCTLMHGKEVEQ